MAVSGDLVRLHLVAYGEGWKLLRVGLVAFGLFDVCTTETLMRNDGAAGRELGVLAVGSLRADANRNGLAGGVGHLRSNGALPDQLVDPSFRLCDLLGHRCWRLELLASWTDGLVGLLGVLRLGGVLAWLVGEVLAAEIVGDYLTGRSNRCGRQRGRVGTHVGDQALFVERLRSTHSHRRAHSELAAGFLLEGRRHKRS